MGLFSEIDKENNDIPFHCIKTSMKGRIGLFQQIVRKYLQAALNLMLPPTFPRKEQWRIKMNDLAFCMDTGIRSSGSSDFHIRPYAFLLKWLPIRL